MAGKSKKVAAGRKAPQPTGKVMPKANSLKDMVRLPKKIKKK